ncbi:NAD(P)-binding protein [Schizopora paradoxa]|uniref:NAD(P)-binding protein n=1 Tax=Schizopora paradoxa TaxID=27342 RepID=A0A0H2RHM6_9AGAM|nr:NAD(P)-binding protein [Schizopora paradoxa]
MDGQITSSARTPKVWLITGTSTGLGRILVKDVVERGDYVIASARRIEAIRDFETNTDETNHSKIKGKCRVITLDVTVSFESIKETIAEAIKFWGRIDVLVHNAGAGMLGISEEVGVEGYQAQFATNFFGPLNVTHAVLPYMRAARTGTVAFIGSRSSWRAGVLMLGTYASSKAAMSAAAEAIGVEVAPFGIRVLEVCPGGLRTTNWDNMILLPTSKNAPTGTGSQQDRIADYEPARTAHVKFMSTLSGVQPGDPLRAASVIVDLIKAEGAFSGYEDSTKMKLDTSSNPWAAASAVKVTADGSAEQKEDGGQSKVLPNLLIIGGDSQRDVKNRCAKVLKGIEEWEEVGRSIDFASHSV